MIVASLAAPWIENISLVLHLPNHGVMRFTLEESNLAPVALQTASGPCGAGAGKPAKAAKNGGIQDGEIAGCQRRNNRF
jgi:hypothetical protein